MKNSPSLQQIKNLSLREQALHMLREAILNGELKPGDALIETDLAAQLGISRAPVREALRILDSEGLVETVPYHGTTVRRLTKHDVEELYSMRILLETFALDWIFTRNPQAAAKRLNAYYKEMLKAGEKGDWKAINKIDRAFHDALIEMSEHSLLMSMWQMVALRIRQVMTLRNMQNRDITQIARNHLPLIEAIESGSRQIALQHLREHIASAGDLVVEGWDSAGEEDESA